MNMTISSVFFSGLPSDQIWIQPLGCGRTGDSQHESAPEKSYKMGQNLKGMFPTSCGIHFMKKSGYSEGKGCPTQYSCSVSNKVLGECLLLCIKSHNLFLLFPVSLYPFQLNKLFCLQGPQCSYVDDLCSNWPIKCHQNAVQTETL